MEFQHKSVLLQECIDALNIRPDGIYLDGTLGGAGHSSQIARRLTEEGENALREKAERVEPALVLAASVLVGIILLAVMLPLLRVMSALG